MAPVEVRPLSLRLRKDYTERNTLQLDLSWIHINHVSVAMTMITRGASDGLQLVLHSLVPRPSHHPVFDCLYTKTEGEGLVTFIILMTGPQSKSTFRACVLCPVQ